MSRLVIDASVAFKWFVPEAHTAHAIRLLDGSATLIAPDLLLAELANTVWKKTRRGELTVGEGHELVAAFVAMPVQTVPTNVLINAAFEIATSVNLSIYDALYVSLAAGEKTQLITADTKLYRAVAASALREHVLRIEDER